MNHIYNFCGSREYEPGRRSPLPAVVKEDPRTGESRPLAPDLATLDVWRNCFSFQWGQHHLQETAAQECLGLTLLVEALRDAILSTGLHSDYAREVCRELGPAWSLAGPSIARWAVRRLAILYGMMPDDSPAPEVIGPLESPAWLTCGPDDNAAAIATPSPAAPPTPADQFDHRTLRPGDRVMIRTHSGGVEERRVKFAPFEVAKGKWVVMLTGELGGPYPLDRIAATVRRRPRA